MQRIRQLLLNPIVLRHLLSDFLLLLGDLGLTNSVSVLGLPLPLPAVGGWYEELRDFVIATANDLLVVQDGYGLEGELLPVYDVRRVEFLEVVHHQLAVLP